MAIAQSTLTSASSTVNSTSTYVTASISPAANSLLIASLVYVVTGGATSTVAGLSLTWTQQKTIAISGSTRITVWTAPAGASPGSGALTFTHSANGATESGVWTVLQVTGQDAASPVVQAVNANATNANAAVTFAAAGAAANRMFSWTGANDSVTYTPVGSYTEIVDHLENSPSCSEQVQWRSDATDTSAGATLSVGTASWGMVGLEIKAAATDPFPPGQIVGDRATLIRASAW